MNAYGAYCLNVPVTATDYLEEQEEAKKNCKEKLIFEHGLATSPDSARLQDGWYEYYVLVLFQLKDVLKFLWLDSKHTQCPIYTSGLFKKKINKGVKDLRFPGALKK